MSHIYRLGLIGWPLAHSFSPRLHLAALRACGLDGKYHLYPIDPLPAGQAGLTGLVGRLRQGELDGLNVTIPHKQAVAQLADDLTPTAQATGAVNTLYRSGGQVVGDNTDAAGFWNDLEDQAAHLANSSWHPTGTALVLGAGGAARATVYALSRHGWQVYLAARRPEQAQRLASDFSKFIPAPVPLERPLAEASARLAEIKFDLLVNATPAGMLPNISESPWPENLPLPPDCWVYDLVYNPPETFLLLQARQQGNLASNGLGMLVHQAALAFLLFTGLPAEKLPQVLNIMRAAL